MDPSLRAQCPVVSSYRPTSELASDLRRKKRHRRDRTSQRWRDRLAVNRMRLGLMENEVDIFLLISLRLFSCVSVFFFCVFVSLFSCMSLILYVSLFLYDCHSFSVSLSLFLCLCLSFSVSLSLCLSVSLPLSLSASLCFSVSVYPFLELYHLT